MRMPGILPIQPGHINPPMHNSPMVVHDIQTRCGLVSRRPVALAQQPLQISHTPCRDVAQGTPAVEVESVRIFLEQA